MIEAYHEACIAGISLAAHHAQHNAQLSSVTRPRVAGKAGVHMVKRFLVAVLSHHCVINTRLKNRVPIELWWGIIGEVRGPKAIIMPLLAVEQHPQC